MADPMGGSAQDDVNQAIEYGGLEERYKDVARQAAQNQNQSDERDVIAQAHDARRQAAAGRRASLRSAMDRFSAGRSLQR